jgi:hypothetical protein
MYLPFTDGFGIEIWALIFIRSRTLSARCADEELKAEITIKASRFPFLYIKRV